MNSKMKKRNNIFQKIKLNKKSILNGTGMVLVLLLCITVMVTISLFIRGLFDGKNEHKNLVHAEAATVETTKITTTNPTTYNGDITIHTNLLNRVSITEKQLNSVINYYTNYEENTNSIFKNKGYIFHNASNKTGLDPIFIIAVAAYTYGWDYSEDDIEALYYNTTNPTEKFENDIMQLAENIYKVWYINRGCHDLDSMVNNGYKYAIDENWANAIAMTMDNAYKIIY